MNIWSSGFKDPRGELWKEKSSAVRGDVHPSASNSWVVIWSGDMDWMTVVFSMERFMRRCEQKLEAIAPISIVISTTNKLLWVWEAHSTGRSVDPLPRHLALSMQEKNSKTHGKCVSMCICFGVLVGIHTIYSMCWEIQYFSSSRPVGNKTLCPSMLPKSFLPFLFNNHWEMLLTAFHMQNVRVHTHTHTQFQRGWHTSLGLYRDQSVCLMEKKHFLKYFVAPSALHAQ